MLGLMSANPERDVLSPIDPAGDDADQLRSLVSAMLSGSYREDSYLWDVVSLCQAKPEFGRRLLALLERYCRLGQMPAAQYRRICERIQSSLPASSAAAGRDRSAPETAAPAPAPAQRRRWLSGRPHSTAAPVGMASTVTARLPEPSQHRTPAPESTLTAPLPASPLAAADEHPAPPVAACATAPTAQSAQTVQAPPALQTVPAAPAPPATPAAAQPRPPDPEGTGLIIEPGAVLRGRYELVNLLGCGGMAAVYRAVDRYRASLGLPDCDVALKIVAPDASPGADDTALGREFHNAQQLSHPNIINVFEIDREAGATFYTMELLEGEQLDELLARIGGPLPLAQALAIVRDLGAAIEHAHSRGIPHADLKPQNVFITYGGHVRVLDFGGLSMPAPGPGIGEPAPSQAAERYRTATPAYASCEQLEGQRVDPRDDVFALAVIAYELISGRHPFDGLSALQARAQHLHARRPAQLPPRGWRALRRGLSWRREQRPREIGPWLQQLGVSEAAPRLPPSYGLRAGAPRAVWGRWVTLAAALLVCLGAAVTLALQQPGHPDMRALLSSAGNAWHAVGAALQSRLGGSRAQHGAVSAATTAPQVAPRPAVSSSPATAAPPPRAAAPAPATGQPPRPTPAHSGGERQRPGADESRLARADRADEASPAGTVDPRQIAAAPGAAEASAAAAPADAAPPAATPALEFSAPRYEVDESSPAARVIVRRHGDTHDELRFAWWTLDDTAKAGVDYAPLGRRTEHMLPGQDHVTLYVPIISNPLRHDTATFFVALGRPGAAGDSPSARASVTIERGG